MLRGRGVPAAAHGEKTTLAHLNRSSYSHHVPLGELGQMHTVERHPEAKVQAQRAGCRSIAVGRPKRVPVAMSRDRV